MFSFSILSFISITLFSNLLAFSIFVFLTGIFDGVDGAIARLTGKSTLWGGFFDSFMDRCSEFVIFFSLLIYLWGEYLWNIIDMRIIVFFSLFGSIMISYLRSRAGILFKGDYDVGLLARSERLFYIFITSLISFFIGYLNEFIFIFVVKDQLELS